MSDLLEQYLSNALSLISNGQNTLSNKGFLELFLINYKAFEKGTNFTYYTADNIKTCYNLHTRNYKWIDFFNEVPLYWFIKFFRLTEEYLLTNRCLYIKKIKGRVILPYANKVELKKTGFGNNYAVKVDDKEFGRFDIERQEADAFNELFQTVYSCKSDYFDDLLEGVATVFDCDLDENILEQEKQKNRARALAIEEDKKKAQIGKLKGVIEARLEKERIGEEKRNNTIEAIEMKYGEEIARAFDLKLLCIDMPYHLVCEIFGDPKDIKRTVTKHKVKMKASFWPLPLRSNDRKVKYRYVVSFENNIVTSWVQNL